MGFFALLKVLGSGGRAGIRPALPPFPGTPAPLVSEPCQCRMGSEVRGPGAERPGPRDVAAPLGRAWAVAAATAAVRVPGGNAEADAWPVRGWADVAVGCVALDGPGRRRVTPDGPGAFSGLDEVIRTLPVVSGGQHAARLRQLRRYAGPVPSWYPDTRPAAGPIRGVRAVIWHAASLVAEFGELLIATAAGLPHEPARPLIRARQLGSGARYRPAPRPTHLTLRLPMNRRLARRTWMCLPRLPGPGTPIAPPPPPPPPLPQPLCPPIHQA